MHYKEVAMVFKPVLYSVPNFLAATGLGRTKAYELFGSGAVKTVFVGRRRFVTENAMRDWLAKLEREADESSS